MKYLLDSNVVIAAMLGIGSILQSRLAGCDEGEVVTSAIVFAEVAFGSSRGKPPSFDRLARFTEEVPVLPFDDAAARAYATLPFKRARFDRLIAAHALSLGLTLVTHTMADFADIPGLRVENWMSPA